VAKRALATIVAACLLVGLAGCNDPPPPTGAYFQNNTDQLLIVKHRSAEDPLPQMLPARATTRAHLHFSTMRCEAHWLIYDSTGTKVIKDPGQICRDQTITIP